MAQVKGITIPFKGDTSKLEAALSKVQTSTKKIDAELKEVNRALKFNPKNVDLLRQKQTLLSQKIKETKEAYNAIKSELGKMDAKGVSKSSEEYRKLQRELITTESKLKHFNAQLQKTAAQASKIGQLGKAFQNMGGKLTAAGHAMRGLSTAAAAVTASIAGITYKAGKAADDLNTLSKQTGISTRDLQLYAASAGLVDVSVETMAKSQARLKKSMLAASEGGTQAKYFEQLGVSVSDSNGHLKDAQGVMMETIAALGQMDNETERDALAMQIFGKSAAELNPLIEDMGETYQRVLDVMEAHGLGFVDQDTLDQANEFNNQLDTIKMLANQAFLEVGAKIAGYLVPYLELAVDKIGDLMGWISKLSGETLAKIGAISGVVAMIAPALTVFGALATAIGKGLEQLALLIQKIPVLGKVLKLLTANPIFLIIGALAALGVAVNEIGADELQKRIETFAKYLAVKIPQIVDTVVKTLTSLMPVIIDSVMAGLQVLIDTIPTLLPVLIDAAIALFQGLVQAVTDILPMLISAAVDLIDQVSAMLPTLVPQVMQAAIDLFVAIVEALPTLIPALIQAAIALIGALIKALPSIFAALKNTVVQLFKGMWSAIKGVFAGVASWFGSIFANAWQAVKNKFAGWASFWGGLWTTIKNKFSAIGTSIASAIGGAVRSGINGVISRIESIVNGAVSIINGAIDLINKIPGVSVGHVSSVSFPRLAKGGVLNGAQTVIAGEAGPEAIIPLDRLFAQMDKMAAEIAGSQPSQQPVVINIYGAAGQSADEIASAVQRKIIDTANRRRLAWQ